MVLSAARGQLEAFQADQDAASEAGPASAGRAPSRPLTKLPSASPRAAARQAREQALSAEDLQTYRDRRRDRYRLRETARTITRHKRLGKCGVRRIDGKQPVEIRERELPAGRVAHYSNLQHCGAGWVCPVCGPKIREQRALEVDAVATAWAERYGVGAVLLLTGTAPHGRHDELGETFDGIKAGWENMMSGSRWQTDKRHFQAAHYIRAADVTHGGNGWHPHFHAIVLARRQLEDWEVSALQARLYDRWADGVEGATGQRPTAEHGLQLEKARAVRDVARYVCQVVGGEDGKRELARELTRADLKTTKAKGQRTPWQILEAIDQAPRCDEDGVIAIGRARDVQLWREYERATKGRHLVQWSRGLREAALGIGAQLDQDELTDEAIAAAEVGGARVLQIAAGFWWAVRRKRGAAALLLRLVETRTAAPVYGPQLLEESAAAAEQLELFTERIERTLDGWRQKEAARERELQRRLEGWQTPEERREAKARAAAVVAPVFISDGDAWEPAPIDRTPPRDDETDSMALAMLEQRIRADQVELARPELGPATRAAERDARRIHREQLLERSGFRVDTQLYQRQLRREWERQRLRPQLQLLAS